MNGKTEKSPQNAKKGHLRRTCANSVAAAAAEIGITPRTLRNWIKQKRVEINASQTAAAGQTILRKVYDERGREIWHAHQIPKRPQPEPMRAELARNIVRGLQAGAGIDELINEIQTNNNKTK